VVYKIVKYEQKVMKKVKKNLLQPPFRQKDLISVSSFIGFCHKYDIKTANEDYTG